MQDPCMPTKKKKSWLGKSTSRACPYNFLDSGELSVESSHQHIQENFTTDTIMSVIDVSRQRRSLLTDATALHHLPADLLEIIKQHQSPKLLDAVAQAALNPSLTDRVFVHFEDAFPDIGARWILNAHTELQQIQVLSAFARILPFAPYLSTYLEYKVPTDSTLRPQRLSLPLPNLEHIISHQNEGVLLEALISFWRLLSFDFRYFQSSVSAALMQTLLEHHNRAVRYVAIRIFCQLLRASDYKLEALINTHVGNEAMVADIDGTQLDYIFLSLHEQNRVRTVARLRQEILQAEPDSLQSDLLPLTPYVVSYGQSLLPRPYGPTGDPPSLVLTDTTVSNLQQLSSLLKKPEPILLYGAPGIGKTATIHEIARQLGMHDGMVTLHLNEQTDAKMLIGLYSTDSKPGSFQWRPGVLTTAVREGRWVLVEDLDRAPTEVLSTLLPLIERNELLIPSRGETIRAANSFRLFATVRTNRGMNGRENLPTLVGMRFWQLMRTEQLSEDELESIILQSYPILRKFIPGILAVHSRLVRLGASTIVTSRGRGVMDRQITLRDLLKWCRRLRECLYTAGSATGEESITESTRDWMFMEALDCFVGSCPDAEMGNQIVYAIAEEMHLSKERAAHYITANIPPLEENESQLRIGRVQLTKRPVKDRAPRSKRPFASTVHAKRLLEQIAIAVKLSEPVLLVGETGIGKTTVVQQLAETLGNKLIAVNLSQQSEVGDLLGGFKPVNVRNLAVPLKEDFEDLFSATGISVSKNQKYLEQIGKCFAKSQWSKLAKLWREAPKMFTKIVAELQKKQAQSDQQERTEDDSQPNKKRKTQSKLQTLLDLRPRWEQFAQNLEQFEIQIAAGPGGFAFSFVEGNLVKAVRNGHWVLLDEINLASPDTLESIADLLTGPAERPSILLSETGEIEKIVAHPDFRIFGAMNPATDIGKRDLPVGIRSRFTELYVRSPDADIKDLLTIIKTYLGSTSNKNDQAADDIARLYLNTKRLAEEKRIVDGANEVPHFSLRTLTRVLTYVTTIAPSYGVRRALYEGFSMGFLTLLERESEKMLMPLIYHHLIDKHGNSHSLLSQAPKHPSDGKRYVKFQNQAHDRQYWLFQGDEPLVERDDYIITPYVERNLLNLVRATSTRRFPILIQGPTSAGKTSMIEYLANFTGNKFVRINNHEHTDLQEYLGTYVSGPDGKLKFQEGVLVQAMRQGHWIVLDELNLAPTDVLEALNRLLDDNRELLIPETQEVVRPHENFILFATQNPPGLYGGRKVLSRAFRNRFLELHFDDIPEDELEFILQQRSRNTSPPDCRRIVSVYKELSRLRQMTRVFEQKDSFATLRDLFRWALREADTREEIAVHGFMVLAERVRIDEERLAVKEIIEKVFKVKIDTEKLYSPEYAPELKGLVGKDNSQGVVWTHAMRRLYVLVSRALRNNEPVLLVGETGCGKTTVCQLLADAASKGLHIVNAHQNTETGDLIGSQRPVRNRGAILEILDADLATALSLAGSSTSGSTEDKLERYSSLKEIGGSLPTELRERIKLNSTRSKALFEWSDGALVEAMRDGNYFLLDEISLADDSVLERLNSVLEPQRTLLLAEKGVDNSFVKGAEGFQFFATMNPGGDFGKKELSPALRNRFTEIWVPQLSGDGDIYEIVRTKLRTEAKPLVEVIVDFATWFGKTFRPMAITPFSVREILVWVQFINAFPSNDKNASLIHGASAIFIDSIGANPSALFATDALAIENQRQQCVTKLSELTGVDAGAIYNRQPELSMSNEELTIGDFSISRLSNAGIMSDFAFHAPTTRLNAMRVVRALQMHKPILLEGSPGVGKTTLVAALSKACGRPLTRINLSDQTDLMDLFGTDVPVEGAEAGNFAWRDAPFLQAMQKGEWVLLDEMNLASQSVLEGLNACLDHRGEVYISELDQVFKRHPDFRLFAAQNPHHQGGGRKGLPASFVNRFIVVYADTFKEEDLLLIAGHNFPSLPSDTVSRLIQFVTSMDQQLATDKSFGVQGAPWEFNLRDVLRWLQLLSTQDPVLHTAQMDDFLNIVIRQRFRLQQDREHVDQIFAEVFGAEPKPHSLYHNISAVSSQVGVALLDRNLASQPERLPSIDVVYRLAELESLMICVKQNIPCILTSQSGFGKSALLEYVAALSGKPLVVFPMNADIDTMDLVGGFEQADPLREVNAAIRDLREFLQRSIMSIIPAQVPVQALKLLHRLDGFNGDVASISIIQSSIAHLVTEVPESSDVGKHIRRLQALLEKPLTLENPRFEWLDGVIIKALESGQWLLLDNANLCNASVLDRLNSLLEPDGFLSVNEHCGPDGEPRIVTPHPDFRIFLTVDPRYGELSRAMRNRAVEINLCDSPPAMEVSLSRVSHVEASMQRYMNCADMPSEPAELSLLSDSKRAALENLSFQDLELLPRLAEQLARNSDPLAVQYQQFLEFLHSAPGQKAQHAASELYAKLPSRLAAGTARIQPLNALVNFAVSQLVPSADDAKSAGSLLHLYWDLHLLDQKIAKHQVTSRGAKLSALNRLERSLVSDKVAAVSKDSTVNLSLFIASIIAAIYEFIGTESTSNWRAQSRLLRLTWQYLDITVALATAQHFDEAVFQAHLTQGAGLFRKQLLSVASESSAKFVSRVIERLDVDFVSGFKLSTGLSMEKLWLQYRPVPIADQIMLNQLVELQRLGMRFDDLRWKTDASVPDLRNAQSTLVQAYQIVSRGVDSAGSLVQELSNAVSSLESRVGADAIDSPPFFVGTFETLRQVQMLYMPNLEKTKNEELSILSNVASRSQMMLATSTDSGHALQYICTLAYNDKYVWDGSFLTSLCNQLQRMESVPLRSLALLEVELPVIGRELATMSSFVVADPLLRLNELLKTLIIQLFSVHLDGDSTLLSSLFEAASSAAVEHAAFSPRIAALDAIAESMEPGPFKTIVIDHLLAAVVGISSANMDSKLAASSSASAWIHFTIGLVKLYVPDRILDPQLRPKMERQFLEQLGSLLEDKMAGLKEFEHFFSAQDTNLQIDILADEKRAIGPLPEGIKPVFRPQLSELSQLQAEFANILKALTDAQTIPTLQSFLRNDQDSKSWVSLIKENTNRLFDRLSGRFEAYQDVTRPAASMLRCFLIGLSLCETAASNDLAQTTESLLRVAPFYGGSLNALESNSASEKSFEFLEVIATKTAVEGQSGFDETTRENVFACFHSFFDDWQKRLEADKKSEETKSNLYKFRGSFEDEEEQDEEEYNELFPTYEEDANKTVTRKSDEVKEVSLKVATIHRHIFLNNRSELSAVEHACLAVLDRVVLETNNNAYIDRAINSKLLPSSLLLLDQKRQMFEASSTKLYNFYTSSNLTEARQLVSLLHSIKAKFRSLQQVDEIGHMQPLIDVIQSCDDVLELVHTDPLAKILPKVERLHGFVYEWQFGGWASSKYGVLELHNSLTDTIIRWRRLELSTWANLFDMEQEKCEEDASSWWFIAYQVIIAVPLSVVDSPEELIEYSKALVQNLEAYFSTSIIGQYSRRLALLKQFQGHLCWLVKDYPVLEIIERSVTNFINYYMRYENVVADAIRSGRAPIEKSMKDVLLMASWKDTNITALRESARKSHLKLFRIVRKFRGILGKDMKSIIAQGLPNQESFKDETLARPTELDAAEAAISSVEAGMPGWLSNHKRMANIIKTTSVMKRIKGSEEMEETGSAMLESFVSNLETSMEELRKETPSYLTEENTNDVKHLKTRKRKLFADTLRDLKGMGLRHNLGQNALQEQESLSTILVSDLSVRENTLHANNRGDYFFHKTLDLVSKVRDTARSHSEDLTSAEVARSIGFVEGVIYFNRSQRRSLDTSLKSLLSLDQSLRELHGLSSSCNIGKLSHSSHSQDLSHQLKWTIAILVFSIKLVDIHGKQSNSNHSLVTDSLSTALADFEDKLIKLGALPELPHGLTSLAHDDLSSSISAATSKLSVDLNDLAATHPNLTFVLEQIPAWTTLSPTSINMDGPTLELVDFAQVTSTLCDTALVAVESARKTISPMPRTEEEPGWLVKQSDALCLALKQFHMDDIATGLQSCSSLLSQLDLSSTLTSELASHLVAIAYPIFSEYFALCEQTFRSALRIHSATAHMGFTITKSYSQIASQGFCSPQEKSDETAGDIGKVESGTGLGDGEGAEDISKDIQPDEDLSELAQEANKEQDGEMEDEKDAVDMADEELEGDMGSVDGKDDDDEDGSKDGDEEEEENEMDEEAGDVDDLDPTAVDEKMWDGDDEKAEKDQQGEKAKGQKDDEQTAPDENAQQDEDTAQAEAEEADEPKEEHDEAEDDAGEEDEDVQAQEELNKQDQTVEEKETLDLPEEMNLDLDDGESASSDDGLDDLSDIEKPEQEEEGAIDDDEKMDEDDAEGPKDNDETNDVEKSDAEEEEEIGKGDDDEVKSDVAPEDGEEEEKEDPMDTEEPQQDSISKDNATADQENAAQSDVKSSGQDQNADSMDVDEQFQANAMEQNDGDQGENAAEEKASAGNKGSASRAEKPVDADRDEQAAEDNKAPERDPFKKLGDALERWHRQQADIKAADKEDETQAKPTDNADEQGQREFQHLEDDQTAPDTQAMGTADNEDIQPMDDSMAIDEEKTDPASHVMNGDEDKIDEDDAADAAEDEEVEDNKPNGADKDNDDPRTGVKTRQGKYNREPTPAEEETIKTEDDDENLDDAAEQLSSTRISEEDKPLRDLGECLQQWNEFQTKSHSHSLSLTSQLRLILTPSQSTKLSGAFRTGKRLNIKRIIPYIASSYKRDKIWMRRAIPTKRTYQIMLCVDDSKSMGESMSGTLAMESLVMVSRSLTMLEAGQVGILGFGSDVFTAHQLTDPFSSDSGAKVLQKFSFSQDRTDIVQLIRQTIDNFRLARQQSSGGADLWQLALILSDGLTPSSAHDAIRRLLREAMEERIMIVFIIMDDKGKKKGDSVLELKEAKFINEGGQSRVVIERYLDTFPFQYYLIVHNLEELPGALAGLLRTWFAEVNS